MSKVSQEVLRIVQAALQRYCDEVDASPMTDNSKDTYKLYPDQFVRWLDDDFEPGANVLRRRERSR